MPSLKRKIELQRGRVQKLRRHEDKKERELKLARRVEAKAERRRREAEQTLKRLRERALPGEQTRRARAAKAALDDVGKHETNGQNRAPWLDKLARTYVGAWMVGQPWCGLACLVWVRRGGRKLSPRTVSTAAIRQMARSRTGGYRRWKSIGQVQVGDLIVYGTAASGPQHVGIYVGGGKIVEGNTSPSRSGSQANGGGVYVRTLAERRGWILGVAEPAY